MLKLVVVGTHPGERSEVLRMARDVSESLPEARVRVTRSHEGRTRAHELDAALFERPLADQIVVLGRPGLTAVSDVRFLCEVIGQQQDVAVVMSSVAKGWDIEDIIAFGGAFWSGPLCQAGGFVGDGRTPLSERLDALGLRSLVLDPSPDPAMSADSFARSA